MANLEYLKSYYPFSDETIAAVDGAIHLQESEQKYFSELASDYDVDNAHVRTNVDGKPIEYLHLIDRGGTKDRDTVRVMYAPMGNGAFNQNIIMRALRQFEADRAGQLFVAAGPAHISNPHNLLSWREMRAVSGGDFAPVAVPILRELARLGVNRAAVLGSSLGATVGLAAMREAANYGIEINYAVLNEPVNTLDRSLPVLCKAFMRTGKQLDHYVKQSESSQLNDAIRQAEDTTRYMLGLGRLSNIAIAKGLSCATYQDQLLTTLRANKNAKIVTAYGTESEISNPLEIQAFHQDERAQRITTYRAHEMPLHGAHHANSDNIDLHAAVAIEGFLSMAREEYKGWF